MANICYYTVRAQGKKKNVITLFCSMPAYNDKKIIAACGTDDDFIIEFKGDTKWDLSYNCEESTSTAHFDVESIVDGNVYDEDAAEEYRFYTLKDKSRILDCIIEAFIEYENTCKIEHEIYISGSIKEKETIDHKIGCISGTRFSTAGKLARFKSLEDFIVFIENNGGIYTANISGRTDYLVCNDAEKNSRKVSMAEEKHVNIITETDFIGIFGYSESGGEPERAVDFSGRYEAVQFNHEYELVILRSKQDIIYEELSSSYDDTELEEEDRDGFRILGGDCIVDYYGKDDVVTVPYGIKEVFGAFVECDSREIILPEGITAIRDGSFIQCDNLVKLVVPGSIEVMEDGSISDCGMLTICTRKGSAADKYARESGIEVSYDKNYTSDRVNPNKQLTDSLKQKVYAQNSSFKISKSEIGTKSVLRLRIYAPDKSCMDKINEIIMKDTPAEYRHIIKNLRIDQSRNIMDIKAYITFGKWEDSRYALCDYIVSRLMEEDIEACLYCDEFNPARTRGRAVIYLGDEERTESWASHGAEYSASVYSKVIKNENLKFRFENLGEFIAFYFPHIKYTEIEIRLLNSIVK